MHVVFTRQGHCSPWRADLLAAHTWDAAPSTPWHTSPAGRCLTPPSLSIRHPIISVPRTPLAGGSVLAARCTGRSGARTLLGWRGAAGRSDRPRGGAASRHGFPELGSRTLADRLRRGARNTPSTARFSALCGAFQRTVRMLVRNGSRGVFRSISARFGCAP